MMDKILISACFLGQLVRYDGKAKTLKNQLIALWQQQYRLISICPEVAGGLSVPREPAEIISNNFSIQTQQGIDVSNEFHSGAQQALMLCKKHKIRFALLKESSPSCGSQLIYDGSFSNQKIVGQGITTKLLRANGIKVYSEDNISVLAENLNKQ